MEQPKRYGAIRPVIPPLGVVARCLALRRDSLADASVFQLSESGEIREGKSKISVVTNQWFQRLSKWCLRNRLR